MSDGINSKITLKIELISLVSIIFLFILSWVEIIVYIAIDAVIPYGSETEIQYYLLDLIKYQIMIILLLFMLVIIFHVIHSLGRYKNEYIKSHN